MFSFFIFRIVPFAFIFGTLLMIGSYFDNKPNFIKACKNGTINECYVYNKKYANKLLDKLHTNFKF